MEIELDILFHSDRTQSLEDCGLESNIEDCDIRSMTFYQINAIARCSDNENYSIIHCNGDSYMCTDSYETLKNKINEKYK